ncbi:Flagellar P-ring protein precursor [Crateriforma conspicua]|nr:flagellar basal body P-ring protein FlgI [Crateriforma conspicua]QDV64503.1 Flagellar P-ring protein precursor [Crateriforma conspicua]
MKNKPTDKDVPMPSPDPKRSTDRTIDPTRFCETVLLRCIAVFSLLVFITLENRCDAAGMRLGDICRVRGQETNTLQGLGLVVGLRGTGDGDAATTSRALARAMQLMGGPVSSDTTGQLNLDDVADAKNVAMVVVTAVVPAVGAQQGDLLDVSVSAISAKSLEGGRLLTTPMLGPRTDDRNVYALAQGQLRVSPDGPATVATVEGGAKMESTIKANFHTDGRITLILDQDFADFITAQRVEDEINNYMAIIAGDSATASRGGLANGSNLTPGSARLSSNLSTARAIDQLHIEVEIPELDRSSPVRFISLLLDTTIHLQSKSNRVVINESDGIVVIGKDVEIAPVLVTHRNLRIEAGGPEFVEIGQDASPETNAKLKDLADALNALDVSTEDLIAIIKTLKAKGDLYGEVVFQ